MEQPDRPGRLERLLEKDAVMSARLEVRSRLWRWAALLVAHSGDSPLWLLGAVVAFIWGDYRCRVVAARVLIATLVSGLVSTLMKVSFRRTRPGLPYAGLYAKLDRHAFPSGHATRAGCIMVSLAPLLPLWGGGALALWAAAVSLARVSLRVHYLLDVVVGLIVGSIVGLALTAAM